MAPTAAQQFGAAWESPSFYVGEIEANADYSGISTNPSKQYYGVDVIAATGAGIAGPAAISLPASSGQAVIGVLMNNPQLAEAAQVMITGVSKVVLGASVSIGAILMVNASGQFIPATSGNFGVAKAFQAGASGNIIAALLQSYGKQ